MNTMYRVKETYLSCSVPNSCGSSWQNTVMLVAIPVETLCEKAAPIARPSAKLWRASPTIIMTATALRPVK